MTALHKKSRLQRKYVNSMRNMGDIPWPPRQFKYPATRGAAGTGAMVIGHCKRPIGETAVRRGKLRRKTAEPIKCGGNVYLRRGSLGKRRVYCEACRARKMQRQLNRRLEQRFYKPGTLTPGQQVREERRAVRVLSRIRRLGVS